MQTNRRWISYDWFKLVVALILLALFIVLMLRPAQPQALPAPNLPAYPWAGFTWNYNAAAQTLTDPNGVPLYALNTEGTIWQPVIPSDIQIKLPEGFKRTQNSFGGWELQDIAGKLLYSWDTEAFIWSAPPAVTEAAALPSAAPSPTAAPTGTSAPAPTAAASTLIPTAAIPAGPTLAPTAASAPTLAPTPAPTSTTAPTLAPTPAPTQAAAGCKAPAPARLTVGKTARVTSNLNLRREPVISDNIIKVNPVGEVLKVLQGPQCGEYQGSAYLWWQVESPDGTVGWSAEATLNGAFYFLEPIP